MLDTSIYSQQRPAQIEGPLDQYAKVMQLRQLMQGGDMNELQRQKLQRDLDEEQAFKEAFAGGGAKISDLMRASPTRALQYQKTQLENEKTQGEIGKTKIETFGTAMKQMRDIIAQARSDADMPVVRETAFRLFGPEAAKNVPAQFTPEWQQKSIMTGDKMIEQMEAQKTRDVTLAGQAETARHNRATEAVATQKLPTELENAKLTNEKLKEEIATGRATKAGAIQSYDTALSTIDRLKQHPGLSAVVGGSILPGQRFIPGTEAANFSADLEAFKSQVFLPMVQNLRGMGALSDAEGRKLTDAVGALSINMSERAFKESIERIKTDLTQTRNRLAGTAQPAPAGAAASAPGLPSGRPIKGVLTPNPDGSFTYGLPSAGR